MLRMALRPGVPSLLFSISLFRIRRLGPQNLGTLKGQPGQTSEETAMWECRPSSPPVPLCPTLPAQNHLPGVHWEFKVLAHSDSFKKYHNLGIL